MEKICSAGAAIKKIKDGMKIMIGGFAGIGGPELLVRELVKQKTKNLTLIANDAATPDKWLAKLINNRQVTKLITSHIGLNPEAGRQMNAGELEVELMPQGTFAEAIRAGGAGLGGVLTPTGMGTVVAEGKQIITVDQRQYILEKPLKADVALIKAHKSDPAGNLIFRRTARNFNPLMAMAADLVIVETEKLVELGQIEPDQVMLPGIFVDFIVVGGGEDEPAACQGDNSQAGGQNAQ